MARTPVTAKAADFSWDDLPEVTKPEYSRRPVPFDINSIPQAIRTRVDESFAAFKPAGHDPERPNLVVSSWRAQECGSVSQAEMFLKLAKKYAQAKEWTLRSKINDDKPTVVHFMAKPGERRPRSTDELSVPAPAAKETAPAPAAPAAPAKAAVPAAPAKATPASAAKSAK